MTKLDIPNTVVLSSRNYGAVCFRHAVVLALKGEAVQISLEEQDFLERERACASCSLCDSEPQSF